MNARAWLIWTVSAALPGLLTRNPLYLLIALLAVAVVRSRGAPARSAFPSVSPRLAGAVVAFPTLFNGLIAHSGDTVLVSLPRALPLIGGPVTLEALVFGFTSGLALLTLLAAFAVFNEAVTPYDLVRLAPRFMYRAGVATSIALTFVPQLADSAREIREAQMVRGHRLRRIGDLPPVVLPLLVDSLERAVQLAEAMESRGFGAVGRGRWGRAERAVVLLGLGGLLLGLFLYSFFAEDRRAGLFVLSAGGLALGGVLWRASRGDRRSRYRTETWSRRGRATLLASSTLILVWLALNLFHSTALVYYPYPQASLPPFDPVLGLSLVLLTAPAFASP